MSLMVVGDMDRLRHCLRYEIALEVFDCEYHS